MTASQVRAETRSALKNNWKKGALITFCFFLMELVISIVISLLEGVPFLGLIASIANIVIIVPLYGGFLHCFMKLVNGENVKGFEFFDLGFSNFKKFWCVTGNILLKTWPYIVGAFVCIFASISLFSVGILFSATGILSYATSASASSSIVPLLLGFLALCGYFVLSILGGIKSLLFYLAFPLVIDNPDITAKEAVSKSKDLMYGNRGKLFCLFLSFIGWILLAIAPYLVFTTFSAIALNPIMTLISIIIGLVLFVVAYCFLIPYIISAFVVFYKKRIENSVEIVQENNQTEQDNPIQ